MFKALKSSELLEPYPSGCARHRIGNANFSFSAWFASRSSELLLDGLESFSTPEASWWDT